MKKLIVMSGILALTVPAAPATVTVLYCEAEASAEDSWGDPVVDSVFKSGLPPLAVDAKAKGSFPGWLSGGILVSEGESMSHVEIDMLQKNPNELFVYHGLWAGSGGGLYVVETVDPKTGQTSEELYAGEAWSDGRAYTRALIESSGPWSFEGTGPARLYDTQGNWISRLEATDVPVFYSAGSYYLDMVTTWGSYSKGDFLEVFGEFDDWTITTAVPEPGTLGLGLLGLGCLRWFRRRM